jgi:hypothetical protein
VPALAVIAKDSQALSPARATLAQLLVQAERLRVETEPLAEQLRRCDEAAARADRALADRDAALAEYDYLVGQAIARGSPRPEPPAALDEAEIALRLAETDARAVINERERVNGALSTANERGSLIQREIASVTAEILVEEAVRVAEVGFTEAFKAMRRHEAIIQGVHDHFRQTGQMHAVEALETRLRGIRTELAADKAVDVAAARRFAEALGRDPAALLEVD